jgi:DNA-binding response OmpR family regulator
MEVRSSGRMAIVIEDDPEIRGIVRTLLTGEGFQVEEAEDGRIALERVFLIQPDLILVDLRLPGLDGTEICKRVRAGRLETCL